MLKFGTLLLMLLVGAMPRAIAQRVDTATNSAHVASPVQNSRVLTQQGRVFDEGVAAEQRPGEAGTAKTRHDTSKSSLGNMKAREAAVGGPDTASHDKNKAATKTSKALAVGQTVPEVDASMPKAGQPGSR